MKSASWLVPRGDVDRAEELRRHHSIDCLLLLSFLDHLAVYILTLLALLPTVPFQAINTSHGGWRGYSLWSVLFFFWSAVTIQPAQFYAYWPCVNTDKYIFHWPNIDCMQV
ncbi:hypothetical protein DL93DRAFT_1142164 [Clavulina sp. PMI_390]|nr:hypothetical protein DL93DRAFT_1142164 [Clavulina sp. PMI_390]